MLSHASAFCGLLTFCRCLLVARPPYACIGSVWHSQTSPLAVALRRRVGPPSLDGGAPARLQPRRAHGAPQRHPLSRPHGPRRGLHHPARRGRAHPFDLPRWRPEAAQPAGRSGGGWRRGVCGGRGGKKWRTNVDEHCGVKSHSAKTTGGALLTEIGREVEERVQQPYPSDVHPWPSLGQTTSLPRDQPHSRDSNPCVGTRPAQSEPRPPTTRNRGWDHHTPCGESAGRRQRRDGLLLPPLFDFDLFHLCSFDGRVLGRRPRRSRRSSARVTTHTSNFSMILSRPHAQGSTAAQRR